MIPENEYGLIFGYDEFSLKSERSKNFADHLTYKGYKAFIEEEDDCYIGTVFNGKDVITFVGKDKDELQREMEISIDEYLKFKVKNK
jgi:predicted RNase H-like HicB family nuclease